MRVQSLGDRWDGDLRVIGNNVFIGEDTGFFTDINGGCDEPWVLKAPP